ncbi:MAG: RNase adapter RapZ [Rhodospirillales bacterium]|nr:RNase adapter RapZ [Rhodospirillales bacterium]MDE0379423.1 RNase adapter RapZ [Rhodospirillales bacterium]
MGAGRASERTLVLVTGMSGAGKSTALKILEDLGYEAIDNLPLSLLSDLVRERDDGSRAGALALGIDSRTRGFDPGDIERYLGPLLEARGPDDIELLFLDCETDILRRRFSETRRPHPLAHDRPVDEGIRSERALLGWLREQADLTIDTSRLSVRDLRGIVAARFQPEAEHSPAVFVLSFAYSRGVPPEADFVFDVRFLANPHHVPALRPLTGRESAVADHVRDDPAYGPFFEGMVSMLTPLLPAFERDGRSYLTIALGCTGGRHRSVATAEHLAEALGGSGWQVTVRHRDLEADEGRQERQAAG